VRSIAPVYGWFTESFDTPLQRGQGIDHGSTVFRADQKPRDLLDRLLRSREADTQQAIAAEASKSLEG
jgi:hypothetical protein